MSVEATVDRLRQSPLAAVSEADRIEIMCSNVIALRAMARAGGLRMVEYLLDMAFLELHQSRRGVSPAPPPAKGRRRTGLRASRRRSSAKRRAG